MLRDSVKVTGYEVGGLRHQKASLSLQRRLASVSSGLHVRCHADTSLQAGRQNGLPSALVADRLQQGDCSVHGQIQM